MQKYDIYVNISLVIIINMKEKIFFLIKDKTYDYKNDYFICSLLIDNKLDNILVKYNSKSDLITLKKLLDDFISFYYLYFSFLKKSDLYLIILINSINHINLDFLNSKRICVNNFYSNIKYIFDNNGEFFLSQGISKNMSLEDDDNVNKIFELLIKLVKSNKDNIQLYYIFENYKVIKKECKMKQKSTLRNEEAYYKICDNWDVIITNYKKNLK